MIRSNPVMRLGAILALFLLWLAPGQAAAQSGALNAVGEAVAEAEGEPAFDPAVQARLDAARRRTAVTSVQSRCDRPRQGDEIVVCVDRGEDLRVPTTAESDPDSLAARRARNNGVPLAPQLDRGSCKGKPGCVIGGWAPPPLYLIDLAAIPEAPEGSDADKVAKGELPDR
ncbi:MAG: hypothetical protein O9283_09865 [Sphingomonadaceae bacterium]|nr:hypothetical protein [Sphingomonadaceae bacterium]